MNVFNRKTMYRCMVMSLLYPGRLCVITSAKALSVMRSCAPREKHVYALLLRAHEMIGEAGCMLHRQFLVRARKAITVKLDACFTCHSWHGA